MGAEMKTEALGEGSHFGNRDHLSAGTTQHHHMGVVDHDLLSGCPTEVTQRLSQEDLAVETLEGWVHLKEQHARVAQHS